VVATPQKKCGLRAVHLGEVATTFLILLAVCLSLELIL
jgi:hypothetical protein